MEKERPSQEIERLKTDVPEELQAYPQFVVWRYTNIAGKLKKPPTNPKNGYLASPINPNTWGTFTQALQALKTGTFNGLGFMFTTNDPFTGTDLDHCVQEDGTLEAWAQDIVTTLNSYTEYSPSKQGIHIITRIIVQLPLSQCWDLHILHQKHVDGLAQLLLIQNHFEVMINISADFAKAVFLVELLGRHLQN